jgi:hypothetical protein
MSDEARPLNAPTTIRKTYEPPQVKPLGSIVELTQAAAGETMDKGGMIGSAL